MITIRIKTGNAAFQDGNKGFEVARILRVLADRAEEDYIEVFINDINGNNVGMYKDDQL